MSRHTYNKGSHQSQVKKSTAPPCAHCRNLGLDTGHALRVSADPSSTVVCPVLLATECQYCFKLGHTTSHCAAKKRDANSAIDRASKKVSPSTCVGPSPAASCKIKPFVSNSFNCLMDDEDEGKKSVNKKNKDVVKTRGEKRKMDQDMFPVLSSEATTPAAASSSTMSFAQALAKPMVKVQCQSSSPTASSSLFDFLPSRTLVSAKAVLPGPENLAKLTYHFNRNWADYESDEE